ncbi:MAG TPA: carboxypeptidase regulatory-like domain-containing protein [Elusimicrobiota bacterium]|nr:carboxypeptidase regulatory-like domain-containing protein [Elusimicrobiota bacterium]
MRTTKIIALTLSLFFCRFGLEAASFSKNAPPLRASSTTATVVANAYIEIAMSDDGKYTIGTVAGDPTRTTDDNKILLYGHPTPWSSDTIIRIDGADTVLGSSGTLSVAPAAGASALSCAFSVSNIKIVESLSIVKSKGTRYEDTVLIKYTLTNTDSAAHNISLKAQLDTMLGSNDGAPFRIPEYGSITSDTEFDNDAATTAGAIPAQAIVFDQLNNPTVVALITFTGIGYTTPDRVVFGQWSTGNFNYTVNNSTFSDSSLMVYWGYPSGTNAVTLAAGQTVEYAFLYGLGGFKYLSGSPFNVGIFRPSELELATTGVSSYQYQPFPFTITAFYENNTAATVTGAQATLKLPLEFSLAAGETARKPIEGTPGSGSVAASQIVSTSWKVQTYGRLLGDRTYAVSVLSGGGEMIIPDQIAIPGIANGVIGRVTDEAGNSVNGASVSIYSGETLLFTTTTQPDGTYIFKNLAAGRYSVRVSAPGLPTTVYDAIVTDKAEEYRSVNPVTFASPNQTLKTFSYPNPVREGHAQISFYTDKAVGAEISLFTLSGELIKTISAPMALAGWREVAWPIDEVANGIYLYQVEAGGEVIRGKIAVVKRAARR